MKYFLIVSATMLFSLSSMADIAVCTAFCLDPSAGTVRPVTAISRTETGAKKKLETLCNDHEIFSYALLVGNENGTNVSYTNRSNLTCDVMN